MLQEAAVAVEVLTLDTVVDQIQVAALEAVVLVVAHMEDLLMQTLVAVAVE